MADLNIYMSLDFYAPDRGSCRAAGRAMAPPPEHWSVWPRQALRGLAPVAWCGRIRGRICRANDMFTNVW